MQYTRYSFFLDKILREIRSNSKKKDVPDINPILRALIQKDPSLLFEQSGHFILFEKFWMNNDKTVVYPLDAEVLDRITNGKYSVSYPEGVIPFANTFILNFPVGYKIAGQPATSVLVHFGVGEDLIKKCITPLLAELDLEGVEEYRIADEENSQAQIMDFIYTRPASKKGEFPLYREHIPWRHIGDVLQDKKVGTDPLHGKSELILPLNEEEREYRFGLIRLIVAMMVYVQAAEGVLQNGFPGQAQVFKGGQYFKVQGAKELTLGGTPKNAPPNKKGVHYRSWHIRQLRDDRYYQGEWAGKPKGTRFVFVSDTYVGDEEVVAKTLM